jgi:hypothetical protein
MKADVRKQILDEMLKMWYWNGIIIVWFLSTFVLIVTGLSNNTYAAHWAATVWAITQLIIRIGILIQWRRTVHDH